MKKKLLAIVMMFAMTLFLAACGGADGVKETTLPESTAEPNAGVLEVVFAAPEGWTVSDVYPGSTMQFTSPDSAFTLSLSSLTERDISTMEGEDSSLSVQEYFEKYHIPTEETLKDYDGEFSTVKICDTDGLYFKSKRGADGFISIGTSWLYNNVIYSLGMFNPDAYDDQGNVKEGAVTISDDEIALYETALASVKPGDGTAYSGEAPTEESIGSFTYDIPEGFTASPADVWENGVTFYKDGSDVTLQLYYTGEDDLDQVTMGNGKNPTSTEEYFNSMADWGEATTIAGFKGTIENTPEDDGTLYFASARFLADDGVYEISMDANAWDENGDIKEGAESLSDEDIATFNAFVESVRKK